MLNNVNLIGRITHDLKLEKININNEQISKISLSLAVDDGKDKNGKHKPIFIPCVIWRKQAESLIKYKGKGSLLHITGKLNIQKYNKDGQDKIFTSVNVQSVLFLDPKTKDDTSTNQNQQQSVPSHYSF
ncbi:single-stranded DNA-binding protein [Candidatus Phytoplasma meliae]|uniref:Single-stranded DNA-binding protein n=1 Tax=Candidatus Phytoplasma meliae TaxID=1848402 RepID=A0ABS5CXY1_9MOLU|nr:single-stranded DNA-binding protein [Candidatus Phytoplasma meliae]MBP5835835.1 single-stranded DNA-binding protein [Candidatus Phytoplasma meliae]